MATFEHKINLSPVTFISEKRNPFPPIFRAIIGKRHPGVNIPFHEIQSDLDHRFGHLPPGVKTPGYYPPSLQDGKSPIGATDNSPAIYCRVDGTMIKSSKAHPWLEKRVEKKMPLVLNLQQSILSRKERNHEATQKLIMARIFFHLYFAANSTSRRNGGGSGNGPSGG